MKILVKFPTRNRPEQFLKVLSMMVSMSNDKDNIQYLISLDADDVTMGGEVITQATKITDNITFVYGSSKSKIEAINRDMAMAGSWDIVLLASDDMIPKVQGWDDVVRDGFRESIVLSEKGDKFTNLDQALWFFDGYQHNICTLIVMGRTRYERFGYLYHPSYISLWCDNEWTDVNQPKKFDMVLFSHQHPAWGNGVQMDALYVRNESYFTADQANYMRRKSLNFPI